MDLVRGNQSKKDYRDLPEIKRKFADEPAAAAKTKRVLEMNVQTSKCLVGIKSIHADQTGEELLKTELTMNVLLDLLFGKSSKQYDQLYTSGLIDETFSYDYTQERGFGFAMVGGDTSSPDQLGETLTNVLLEAREVHSFTEEQLTRAKKKKIGAFLRSINSPEYIANQFTRYAFNDMNLFDVVPALEKISLSDVNALAEEVISKQYLSEFQIIPIKK